MSTDRPIRILHLVTELNIGGIEMMIMNHYRKIDKNLIQFDFLINRKGIGDLEEEILNLGGRIFRMCELYPWKFSKYKKQLKDFLKSHDEYQIIHSHLEERSYFAAKIINDNFKDRKFIIHAHNYYPFTFKKFFDFKQYFREYFRRSLQKTASSVQFYSSTFSEKWLFGKSKILNNRQFFPNAIDEKQFTFFSPQQIKTLGCLSRIVPQKNIEFAIKLISLLPPEFTLKIAGIGKKKYVNKLKKLTSELQIANRVEFCGFQKSEKFFQEIDLLLLPSLFEGLGISAIESQFSGKKVIASDKVPFEANLGGVTFLKADFQVWVNEILKMKPQFNLDLEKADDFCVEKRAKWLSNFYLNML